MFFTAPTSSTPLADRTTAQRMARVAPPHDSMDHECSQSPVDSWLVPTVSPTTPPMTPSDAVISSSPFGRAQLMVPANTLHLTVPAIVLPPSPALSPVDTEPSAGPGELSAMLPPQQQRVVHAAAIVSAANTLWHAADGVTHPTAAPALKSSSAAHRPTVRVCTPAYTAARSYAKDTTTFARPQAAAARTPVVDSAVPAAWRQLPARWAFGMEKAVERARRGNNPAFVLAAVWHAISARFLLLQQPGLVGKLPGLSASSADTRSATAPLLRAMGAINVAFSALGVYACGQNRRAQHGNLAVLCMANLAQLMALGSLGRTGASAGQARSWMQLASGGLACGDALVAFVTLGFWLRRVLLLRQRHLAKQQKQQQ
ncbi:hypothetical protein THASP1DRAFT_28448 [Thamnocephalis sphaerospora]|uniref:Uncharacterized protein n=1 Tax=Thamnocephalis sphaerospora TaxID=78915 RepID=A0A4P9XU80_9FUNG|nr:hypothetical protein THASP1DRAFT_28448 [Thamnocephalis sphaerospora]|eukprot:RKP09763.1 hypothetical protein THASP1DRAFT_28448 [Thamnocephalis sphaerospora]